MNKLSVWGCSMALIALLVAGCGGDDADDDLGDTDSVTETGDTGDTEDTAATDTGDTDSGPGADEVWVHLVITCAECASDAKVQFAGKVGAALDGMPDYYEAFESPAFPLDVTRPEGASVMGAPTPWAAGETTFMAFQDTVPGGFMPEDGEPASELVTLTLVAGEINEVNLDLVVP